MFGNRLKFILENKNISQVQLANELNLTAPAINRWCNNVTEPDTTTLVRIANILNVTTDYLLGNNVSNTIDNELKEKEVLKNVLRKNGFMKNNDDLTDEELENAMKFLANNKEFLKKK